MDPLLDPAATFWSEPAPDTALIVLETTRGDFTLELIRAWAPRGVDRFYNLARAGFYDDVRFHRVVSGFITQWGVSGHPERDSVWYDRGMPDDPVVASNLRGSIAFAFTEPGTRSTQVYINMVDNTRLDAQGFAPLGRVVDGMESVVDSIFSGYGEESGGGVRAGNQAPILEAGNAWLDGAFPALDRLLRARVLGDRGDEALVLASLQTLFDALESGDASALPTVLDERIVMHSTNVDAQGRTTFASATLEQMIQRIESSDVPSIERMFEPEVRVSGDLATIWTPYDFYRGGELSHCGIDAALLERRDGRWVITALSWTRAQPPACALHPDGPPER